MKNRNKLFALCMMTALMVTHSVVAQQVEDANTPEVDVATGLLVQDLDVNRSLPMDALIYLSYGLSSEDGNYMAQNAAELQTYKDLGLEYKFIEEEYLRRQLNLPDKEGIIISAADESGEGFQTGFRAGDIVMEVDGEPVDTQYDFVISLTKNRGNQSSAKLRRDGKMVHLGVVLSESSVEIPKRWIIGVYVDEISDVTKAQLNLEGGAAITQLTDDGPASKMGILVHDIITHIDGNLINNLDELKAAVQDANGNSIKLDVVRMGKQIQIEVDPSQVPDESSTSTLLHRYYQPNIRWDATANQRAEYRLSVVPTVTWTDTDAIIESTLTPEARLDRLEESMRRIEEVLKDQLKATEDE